MALLDAAPLELRHGSLEPRRVLVVGVHQQRLGAQHVEHRLGIRRPVGRAVQHGARLQPGCHERHQVRAHDPALVVLRLSARGREEHPDRRQGRLGDALPHHVHRVVVHHADVVQPALVDLLQDPGHPRSVHVDREDPDRVVVERHLDCGVPEPEPDLERHRPATEQGRQVDRPVGDAEARQKDGDRLDPRVAHASAARVEGPDVLHGTSAGEGVSAPGRIRTCAHGSGGRRSIP